MLDDSESIEMPTKSTKATKCSKDTAQMYDSQQLGVQRNLDHLNYSENLYDFMRSLIPFSVHSNCQSLNQYLLRNEGIQKDDLFNIYYNDTVGKT